MQCSSAWSSRSAGASTSPATAHCRLSRRHAGAAGRQRVLRVNAELFKLGDSWVATPKSARGSDKPKVRGIVHFLGGAAIGAAPQVVYSVLLELLAAAGYTVIATPYAVTFKHLDCAEMVHQRFLQALQEMRKDPFHAALVPVDKPILGVGHSNGSLLHLLINAKNPGATQGNVIMSFNNKPVSEAIPLSMQTVLPTVAALRGAPLLPQADTAQVLQTVARMVPAVLPIDIPQGQISSARLALDQINTVLDEVNNGVTEFSPSPAESKQIIGQGYDPSRSPVLLVRFSNDSIDGSHEILPLLQSADPGNVSTLVLPGSHNTPCAADLKWRPGPIFTPFDALAQLAKLRAEQDVRRLSTVVVDFLDNCIAANAEAQEQKAMQLASEQQQQEGEGQQALVAAVSGRAQRSGQEQRNLRA